MNFIFGLFGIALSYFLIRYRDKIIGYTGPWGWAEKWLGAGHSYAACIIVGVVIFFVSLSILTGKMDDILGNSVGSIFPDQPSRR